MVSFQHVNKHTVLCVCVCVFKTCLFMYGVSRAVFFLLMALPRPEKAASIDSLFDERAR